MPGASREQTVEVTNDGDAPAQLQRPEITGADAGQFEARPFGTTRIFDRNGRLLSEVNDPDLGWRTNVTIEQVSPHLINATLAAEDPSFRRNAGVDPAAILRAVVINYEGQGSSGGSTITQQLVR
ncbi:MAG: transglycosylase domain-containing protein, partial [Actinobacteria bacterium]|nr:transglycosylase domain-containing protein [Actinomycetota bacterium]